MSYAGTGGYTTAYYEDLYVSESDKNKRDYLIGNIDHWIGSLIRRKDHIRTFRNYYNGIRDNKEFAFLTDNYGIGTPSSLKFTNLIKTRVDSLVEQVESDNLSYMVTCTDDKTIDLIQEQKKKAKVSSVMQVLKNFTTDMQKSAEANGMTYSELSSSVQSAAKKSQTNFMSDFEIAAQKVLAYFENSNQMKLRQKLRLLTHDLIVTGECYYRVYYERRGSDPILEVVKPENFFHNKSTNTPYLDGTDAVAHREYLTHKEVVARYGKYMSKDDIKHLFGDKFMSHTGRSLDSGIDIDIYYSEDDPILTQHNYNSAYTIEVLHVEWLATNDEEIDAEEIENLTVVSKSGLDTVPNKKVQRVDRYEGTRLGGTVYVNCGKVEDVPRSQSNPYMCGFSYGGVINNDRAGKPYSVVGALKDIQDIYDLTVFHRDNLVANSGSKGSRVNLAGIPKVLGNDFMDRLFKFIALKKNGVELIDPTEPGAQMFNHYGEFNDSVDGTSLQAINALLQTIERQADMIAGTTPAMLGQIEEREAVGNVNTGIKQSLLVNQSLFELVRSNHVDILGSLLSTSQVTYRDGKKISYIAGSTAYTFEILPDSFSYSDFAIAISYASKDQRKLADMKILAKELIATQQVDPDVMAKVILSESVTEISRLITENWAQKKEENDQLSQASSAVEQLEKKLKETEAELSNVSQQLEASRDQDRKLKAAETDAKINESAKKLGLEEKKLDNDKEYNDAKLENDDARIQLEREQLYLGSGNSKEIRNS